MLSFRRSLGSAIHNNKITLHKTCTERFAFLLWKTRAWWGFWWVLKIGLIFGLTTVFHLRFHCQLKTALNSARPFMLTVYFIVVIEGLLASLDNSPFQNKSSWSNCGIMPSDFFDLFLCAWNYSKCFFLAFFNCLLMNQKTKPWCHSAK